MKRTVILTITIAFICAAWCMSGCAAKTTLYGQEIAEKNITRIGDILANPAKSEGKTVKIKGKITEECPSGCWFMLKDDSGTMYVNIHPKNFVIPQASGRMAAVEGVVKKEGPKVSIIGSGVEIE